jgi:hypothetical protein
MSRVRLAVLIPALAGTMVAGIAPAMAEPAAGLPSESNGIPARYSSQVLNWHPCEKDELPAPPPPGAENI